MVKGNSFFFVQDSERPAMQLLDDEGVAYTVSRRMLQPTAGKVSYRGVCLECVGMYVAEWEIVPAKKLIKKLHGMVRFMGL